MLLFGRLGVNMKRCSVSLSFFDQEVYNVMYRYMTCRHMTSLQMTSALSDIQILSWIRAWYRLPQALSHLPLDDELAEFPKVSESRIQTTLAKLNPSKACGPDGILNWLLKDYAELLAFPITKIINASFKEQRLPRIWKLADVSPLPKT